MLLGPLFTRELVSAPRRPRQYIARTVYVGALLVLATTAWLVLTGTQVVQNLGDIARFGQIVFAIIAPLQLALALFFSALLAASAIAQEKDRGTLDLLLMTSLTNVELVLGRVGASLLGIFTLWLASLPFFAALVLLGGISFAQVARLAIVTLLAAAAAGSIGSTIAFWRERTFQSLALTTLGLVGWVAAGEAVARQVFGAIVAGIPADQAAIAFSPVRAVLAATQANNSTQIWLGFLAVAGGLICVLNILAIWRIRKWNPTQTVHVRTEPEWTADGTAASVHKAPGKIRQVWNNPVLWREICTWAHGRRILLIRVAYWVVFALAVMAAHGILRGDPLQQGTGLTLLLAPLFVLSLILVNAVAVTALTNERDGKTLDLLLVTDLTPKEFVFGKLAGIFFVAKEMWLLPLALCGYLATADALSWENALYLAGGLSVMLVFVAVLGLHAGMSYDNSRAGIGVSLGTVFFLFLGIAACMRIMVAFSGAFELQFAPFLAFTLGGGLGLFFALGVRNQSSAILLASLLCPTATFWAITSFLQHQTLGVFVVTALAYGFVTAAMLIPAVYEFDVATGRTTSAAE